MLVCFLGLLSICTVLSTGETMKETVFSLRSPDMRHVLWSGIRPRPEVDLELRLVKFAETDRLIKLRLRHSATGSSFDFETGCTFSMAELGNADYERLQTTGAELTVLVRYLECIEASSDRDGVLIRLHIQHCDVQAFRLLREADGCITFDRDQYFFTAEELAGRLPHQVWERRPVSELA